MTSSVTCGDTFSYEEKAMTSSVTCGDTFSYEEKALVVNSEEGIGGENPVGVGGFRRPVRE